MNEISPWFIYLVMQADSLIEGVKFFSFISFMILLMIGILYAISYMEGHKPSLEWAKNVYKYPLIFSILSGILLTLIPSTKSLCVIYMVPKIANNEEIKDEMKEMYSLAKEGLKEILTDNTKGEK